MRRHDPAELLMLFVPVFVLISSAVGAQEDHPYRSGEDRPADILHIKLELDVNLKQKRVDGTATISFETLRPVERIWLHAKEMDISGVSLSPWESKKFTETEFEYDGKRLIIPFDDTWERDRQGKVRIDYGVEEPASGLHFFQPTASNPEVPYQVWSQGETESNRYWFPCFDKPTERQTTELIVTVNDKYQVVSNGTLISRTKHREKDTVTYHWEQERPHVSYLVTLVVGEFAVQKENWNGIPVSYYVPPEKKQRIEPSFGRTTEMLDFFSNRFGIDYPWSKYAQVVVEQFMAGGMENTSASTLHEYVLHTERALKGQSPDGLIAHELGHQWWGDLVTCKSWAHLWLNEGWATYSEVLWTKYKKGKAEAAYELWQKGKRARMGGKDHPVVYHRYDKPWDQFDARAYAKGGYILHMLRQRLGDTTFWTAARNYGIKFSYDTVETHDFRKVLEDTSGLSLKRFFHDWLYRPGHPVVSVTSEYRSGKNTMKLTVEQTQEKPPFSFPFHVAFRFEDHDPRVFDVQVSEKSQVFHIDVPARPKLIRVDPDQDVLAKWNETKAKDLWKRQLLSDPDPVLRIRAARHFGEKKTPRARALLAEAFKGESFRGTAVEIAKNLGSTGGKQARETLVNGLSHKKPDVRKTCAEQLASFFGHDDVKEALKAKIQKGDPSPFVVEAALEAYGELQADDAVQVLSPYLEKSSYRETIRRGALRGLGKSGKEDALDLLIKWAGPDRPARARDAAIRGLRDLFNHAELTDEQVASIRKTAESNLHGSRDRIKKRAIRTLRELGKQARPAIETLEAIAKHDTDRRTRTAAKRALEEIENGGSAKKQVKKLKEEIKKLKKEKKKLEQRLKKREGNEQ